MRTAVSSLILGILISSAPAWAQQAAAPPERVVALKAGRMVDGVAGRVVEGATIVVRGDRIEALRRG